MTYLPEMIVEDILSRLPVKSLLRFRCVCKAWCTFISHPQFVKTHLRRQHERPAIGLITLRSKDDPPQKGDLAPVDLEFHLGLSSKSTAEILGSCHGLLCVVDRSKWNEIPKSPQKLILWNPSTRQRNHIPSPTFVSYKKCVFCFFYDSDADDYKIVRLLTLQSMDRTVIDVFTLKTNNWRSVEETHSSVIESWSATYFNGNIHWIACNNYHQTMVFFSLREDKFQLLEMELPSRSDVFDLRVLGGCLCLDGVCSGDLWMMEEYGIKESWKRLITFPYRIGDDSNGMLPRVLLSLENDVLLVAHEGKLVLCESKNNTWKKNITSFKWAALYQMKVGLYIETLVSPYGGDKLTPMNRRGKAIEEKRGGKAIEEKRGG